QHGHAALLIQPNLHFPVFAYVEVHGKQRLPKHKQCAATQRDRGCEHSILANSPKPWRIVHSANTPLRCGQEAVLLESAASIEVTLADVFAVGNDRFGIRESFKNAQFRLEFARQPKIIRVKECEEITGCLADPGIPRRTRTASAGQAE